MRHALANAGRQRLSALARSRVLLAFDFDGTLAPIVADRERASMRPRTRQLFAAVCGRYPCAILSGRGRDDVAARVGAARLRHVVGNHGIEPCPGMHEYERAIDEAYRQLPAVLPASGGFDVEHKRYSLAVHYREGAGSDAASHIVDAVRRLAVPLRPLPGIRVVNLLPDGAPDKGDALRRLELLERCDRTLYVGDDVTDEDVFRLGRDGDIETVRVGALPASAARWFLRDQSEIDALLRLLLRARATGLRRAGDRAAAGPFRRVQSTSKWD